MSRSLLGPEGGEGPLGKGKSLNRLVVVGQRKEDPVRWGWEWTLEDTLGRGLGLTLKEG